VAAKFVDFQRGHESPWRSGEEARDLLVGLLFVLMGVFSFDDNILRFDMLGGSGVRLTHKMRILSFRQLLRREMGSFDEKEISVAALTTRLAMEATLVKGITGDSLSVATLTVATICVGVGVALSACWQLALVVMALIPFYAAGGYVQFKRMSGFEADSKEEFANSGGVASEAVDDIRTITGLGVQDDFIFG
jgi:ABC-type multidrug transport system fused ATPase/permease subunit